MYWFEYHSLIGLICFILYVSSCSWIWLCWCVVLWSHIVEEIEYWERERVVAWLEWHVCVCVRGMKGNWWYDAFFWRVLGIEETQHRQRRKVWEGAMRQRRVQCIEHRTTTLSLIHFSLNSHIPHNILAYNQHSQKVRSL